MPFRPTGQSFPCDTRCKGLAGKRFPATRSIAQNNRTCKANRKFADGKLCDYAKNLVAVSLLFSEPRITRIGFTNVRRSSILPSVSEGHPCNPRFVFSAGQQADNCTPTVPYTPQGLGLLRVLCALRVRSSFINDWACDFSSKAVFHRVEKEGAALRISFQPFMPCRTLAVSSSEQQADDNKIPPDRSAAPSHRVRSTHRTAITTQRKTLGTKASRQFGRAALRRRRYRQPGRDGARPSQARSHEWA